MLLVELPFNQLAAARMQCASHAELPNWRAEMLGVKQHEGSRITEFTCRLQPWCPQQKAKTWRSSIALVALNTLPLLLLLLLLPAIPHSQRRLYGRPGR